MSVTKEKVFKVTVCIYLMSIIKEKVLKLRYVYNGMMSIIKEKVLKLRYVHI